MAAIPVRYTSRAGSGGTASKPVGYGTSSPLSALLAYHAGASGYQAPQIANEYAANPATAGIPSAAAPPSYNQPTIPNSPAPINSGAIDFSTDPILQRVTALARMNAQQAQAGADASAKQALINSGFGDVARSYRFGGPADELLGLGDTSSTGDEATALAAQNNPYSVAALLGKAHTAQNVGIDQNQNLQNLFYSSNRANLLGDEAQNYLGKQYGAQQDLAGQLGGIGQQLIAARQGAEGQVLGEQENAYMRALQNAQFTPQTQQAPQAPQPYVPVAGTGGFRTPAQGGSLTPGGSPLQDSYAGIGPYRTTAAVKKPSPFVQTHYGGF
jgi:hypothetical protein